MSRHTRRHIVTKMLPAMIMSGFWPSISRSSTPSMPDSTTTESGNTTAAPLRVLIGFSRHSASDDLLRAIEPELAAAAWRPVAIELKPGDLGIKAVEGDNFKSTRRRYDFGGDVRRMQSIRTSGQISVMTRFGISRLSASQPDRRWFWEHVCHSGQRTSKS